MGDHLTELHEAASTANLLLFRWQLVRVRLRHGLTVDDVAERLGVTPKMVVDQMERPDSDPHLSTVRRYALAVGALVAHDVIPEVIAEPERGEAARAVAAAELAEPTARPEALWPERALTAAAVRLRDWIQEQKQTGLIGCTPAMVSQVAVDAAAPLIAAQALLDASDALVMGHKPDGVSTWQWLRDRAEIEAQL